MAAEVVAAEVVVPCAALEATQAFFTDRLGMRVEAVLPADDPSVVVVTGHGVRLRLERDGQGAPGALRLRCRDLRRFAGGETALVAPNGTRVDLVEADPPVVVPPGEPEFVLSRLDEDVAWVTGRAGMRYRDLIPGRQGGRFGASHIQIENAGPVPDYVHFHRVRFQLIYCYRGWVRLAYEDQGEPFVLEAGDCVLQPPQIRHRVLECSAGLEVVEVSCPAVHETWADHVLNLPTAETKPEREFGGQRFVRDIASAASWSPWRGEGFEVRELGVGTASSGIVGARVVRALPSPGLVSGTKPAFELLLTFVLEGGVDLQCGGRDERLGAGDCFVVPAGMSYGLSEASGDLELFEVSCPASAPTGGLLD